jgi:hypothetical protein
MVTKARKRSRIPSFIFEAKENFLKKFSILISLFSIFDFELKLNIVHAGDLSGISRGLLI